MTETFTRAAATLILVREAQGGAPELLMIQRAATMLYGEAWVFPGGRVDAADLALAAEFVAEGGDVEDYAGRIAAIRETIEEAGVPIGLSPIPHGARLAAIRAGLHARRPFAELLAEAEVSLDPEAVLPFTRWEPPLSAPKRFDTRFYIARAPEEAVVEADGGETIAICWVSAAQMLARDDVRLMFPTLSNLHRIAAHASYDEIATHAALFPRSHVIGEMRDIDGEVWLCVPPGQGYADDFRITLASMTRPGQP